MNKVSISVTEAARNFSDCINRARYQGTTFVLHKGGKPVATLTPGVKKPTKGAELAVLLRDALKDVHLDRENATAWLKELEESRAKIAPPVGRW
jgi:antitoxin (DNA-binding transcriptional repressor) of toxin-antitoxin stability system